MASLSNASVINTVTGENVTNGNLWIPYARWIAGVGGEALTASSERSQEQELIVIAANPDPAASITVRPRLSEEFLTEIFGTSVSTRTLGITILDIIIQLPSIALHASGKSPSKR